MADPNDQDMMIYEDHPEPLAQPDDAKESSLRDFLERHFEHLRTTDQSSQLYTTLTRLVSKDWRALWAEFSQPADHEILLAEKSREQKMQMEKPSPETEARLNDLISEKDQLYQDNEDWKSKFRNLENTLASTDNLLKQVTESDRTELRRYQESLSSKDEIIDQLKIAQTKMVAQYKLQLDLKKQEVQELHKIVRSRSQKGDPYDDEYVSAKFRALEAGISDLVKRHFSANGGTIGWNEYDSVKREDDRDFFLAAYIAKAIARDFFGPDAYLFSLNEETRKPQAIFEQMLQESHVPPQDIVDWRIQTVKVAELLASQDEKHFSFVVPRGFIEKLRDVYKRVSNGGDWSKAKDAIAVLYRSAYELALALRSCRAEFTWSQAVPLNSLNTDDVVRIPNYNIGSGRSTGQPKKILFGPVYKHVDGNQVLLNAGTVLYG